MCMTVFGQCQLQWEDECIYKSIFVKCIVVAVEWGPTVLGAVQTWNTMVVLAQLIEDFFGVECFQFSSHLGIPWFQPKQNLDSNLI